MAAQKTVAVKKLPAPTLSSAVNASTVSKAIASLKKGSTYKVYVRSYKTVSGTKYYSAWSAVKEIKITK